MWSSLSSYLYNDDGKESSSAAAPRTPVRSPLTALHSVGSHKGSGSKVIRGVVVGLKGTGKTCLIRRLRGEDPFQTLQSTPGQKRSNNLEKRKLMALVPWKVPKSDILTTEQEECVQLYVSEGAAFLHSQDEKSFRKELSAALQTQRGKEWNFVVWMIDPSMKDVFQYLQLGLHILFLAGNSSEQMTIQHLCILLNFRDLQQQQVTNSSFLSHSREIVETVRKSLEKDQTDKHDKTAGNSTKAPIIAVYESSMFNGYGLQQLHSFITLPYLSQKKEQLLRRAKLAEKQHLQLTRTLMESKLADYSDFVAASDNVVTEEKPDEQTFERRKLEEEKETLKRQLKQQKQVLDSKMYRRKTPLIVDNQISSDEQAKELHSEDVQGSSKHGRKLFPSANRPTPTKDVLPAKDVGETSLESFFSEEDDDEAKVQQIDKPVQVLDSDDSSSDSDDSDDDFYIDISGTRSSPHHFAMKTSPKIKPSVSDEHSSINDRHSNIGLRTKAVGKDEGASNKDENDVDKSGSHIGSIYSDSSAGDEESEQEDDIAAAVQSEDSDSHVKNETHERSTSNEEDAEKFTEDAKSEGRYYNAEYDMNEDDFDVIADSQDDGMKANGDRLRVESEIPVDETNGEDNVVTEIIDVDESAVSTNAVGNDSLQSKNEVAADGENTFEPHQNEQIVDDDVSGEKNEVQAPQRQILHDDGDDDENAVVVPASQGDESSKSGEDANKIVSKVDDGVVKKGVLLRGNGKAASAKNVSMAAKAAIEQARLEAEQMMTKSHQTKQKKTKKKEKAEKKEKTKKPKKKKKREDEDEEALEKCN